MALDSVRSAAASDDVGALLSAMDRLDRGFEGDRTRDRVGNALAVGVLDAMATDAPGRSVVRDYLEATTAVEQARIDLQHAALEAVYGIAPSDDVVDRVDATVSAYDRQAEAREALEAERRTVTLPPLLVIATVPDREVPLGETVTVETDAVNAGDLPATDLTVSVETTLAATWSPRGFEAVEPAERVPVTVSLPGSTAGESTVRMTVSNESVGDTIEFAVDAVPKGEWIDRAIAVVGRVGDGLPSGIPGRRGLENRVRAIERRLRRIARGFERGRRPVHAGNAALESVRVQLDAIASRLRAGSESNSDRRMEALLADMVDDARALLENAIEANPAGSR